MKKIMNEGIEHAQVCFIGIGDDVPELITGIITKAYKTNEKVEIKPNIIEPNIIEPNIIEPNIIL